MRHSRFPRKNSVSLLMETISENSLASHTTAIQDKIKDTSSVTKRKEAVAQTYEKTLPNKKEISCFLSYNTRKLFPISACDDAIGDELYTRVAIARFLGFYRVSSRVIFAQNDRTPSLISRASENNWSFSFAVLINSTA
ncbi:hypothetical protein TSAR_008696 [Trichomalopsis sarcophagae]|uniref:Uncharacterized protein n=1 Tax=Trichomalopsis sarcophagae TaxID=543379 RepID=A0A232F8U1_9HYME|nr:hypothetical protein TSAR_008696 [Trichomalopsis sarcophagae]